MKIISKHKGLFLLTVLSLLLMIVGFLHIPILKWCGVDVFALRGVLVITAFPIIAVFAIPISVCCHRWSVLSKNEKYDEKYDEKHDEGNQDNKK